MITTIMLSVILATFICIVVGCNRENDKNKKEKVKITVKTPAISMDCVNDVEVNSTADFLEVISENFCKDYTKYDVDVNVVEYNLVDEAEAIEECFDTESAADVVCGDFYDTGTYIHIGRAVPLDDIITNEIKKDIKKEYLEMGCINNKTYFIPFTKRQNILAYNKELFKKCGLDEYISEGISNWSIKQWNTILDTLTAKLPNNCYPMMMYSFDSNGATYIMTLLRAFGCTFFDNDGRVKINTPEGIKALEWIKQGYDKNWYPNHCENLTNVDNVELFDNGQLAIHVVNSATFSLYDIDMGYVNFPGNLTHSFVTGFEIFDNKDAKKIEASKAFVKYIYENEKMLEYSTGGIPVSMKIREKYIDRIGMLKEFSLNKNNEIDFSRNTKNWHGLRKAFYPNMYKLFTEELTPVECAKSLDKDMNEALDVGNRNNNLHK